MIFNSMHFLIFFPVVCAVFFTLRHHQAKALWLVLASCYFYMALVPIYILVLILVIVIDFGAGILLETYPQRKKLFLVASLVANVAILAVFKYFNFAAGNWNFISAWLGVGPQIPHLDLILPIGLSFHTFQSLSYTIEVYRGHQRAERDFIRYSLYVLFFPQLVAGPIERPQNLLPQFQNFSPVVWNRISSGLRAMLVGFFKKMIIADGLALYVNAVYDDPRQFDNGLTLILATVCFSFQIYCDFSGYTDIARGSARVLGIDLMKNFNRPYVSKSVTEFWRRWHISLSTWFRDYVYVPLGGNRGSKARNSFNLFLVFAISGLWHGASWNFVIWGVLHGLFVLSERSTRSILPAPVSVAKTFVLVSLAWIFFRAETYKDAIYIFEHLHQNLLSVSWGAVMAPKINYGAEFVPAVIGLIGLLGYEYYQEKNPSFSLETTWLKLPEPVRLVGYTASALALFNFSPIEAIPFIYFQF